MASTLSFLLMEIARGLLVLGVYVVKRRGSGQKADQLITNTMERGSYGEANCLSFRILNSVVLKSSSSCLQEPDACPLPA
jgi:hypothetical protein